MRHVLLAAVVAVTGLLSIESPASANDGCYGLWAICSDATECRTTTVNVCQNAQECHGIVNVCGGKVTVLT